MQVPVANPEKARSLQTLIKFTTAERGN